jgi:hypothetical protein
MGSIEAFWGGIASLAGPSRLPLLLPFAALLRLAGPLSVRATAAWVAAFCIGFAASLGGLEFADTESARFWGWIVLAAGLGLAGFGLAATGAFGQLRPPGPVMAALLGACLAFGATPFRGPILQASDTTGLGLYTFGACVGAFAVATALRPLQHQAPSPAFCGVALMVVGGLVAMGAFAGLGFWLIEWVPALAQLG